MPDPSDLSALYQEWLEIPPERLPPNHYALLGIADFESDDQTIEAAAKSRSAYLHQIAAGPQRKIVQAMLGQVAIARRTLMSPESRAQYDAELRDAQKVSDGKEADSVTTSIPRRADAGSNNIRNRSKKSGEYKVHAISAGVLLLIVGVIYWVNRDPGGRKAVQIHPPQTQRPDASAVAARNRSADTPAVKDAPNRVSAAATSQNTQRKSPIAKRRERGSGIGVGMDSKFGDVLSEIADAPDDSPREVQDRTDKFRPLGGLLIGPVSSKVDFDDWPKGLAPVPEFPDQLGKRYEGDLSKKWYEPNEEHFRVKKGNTKQPYVLTDTQFRFNEGAAIAFRSSLTAQMRGEIQIGFVIDGVRFGLRPYRAGIEVVVKDRDPSASTDSVCKIKTKSKTCTFTLVRSVEKPESIRWYVRTDDQDRTGTIDVSINDDHPNTALYIAPPRQNMKDVLWIDELKTRDQAP